MLQATQVFWFNPIISSCQSYIPHAWAIKRGRHALVALTTGNLRQSREISVGFFEVKEAAISTSLKFSWMADSFLLAQKIGLKFGWAC